MEVVAAPQTDVPAGSAEPWSGQSGAKHHVPSFRHAPPPSDRRGAGIGLTLSVFAFLAAASVWLWLVQEVPARTAFVYFADSYPSPFASPGWIDEDGDRFDLLDGLTLQVERAGFGDGLTSRPWDQLDTALRALRPQISRGGALIVDVRGVGAVTPDGRPALIPPFADPFDSTTWIPLADFCGQILSTAEEAKHVHLILDCLTTRTDWDCGWLYNGFPEAVSAWADQPDVAGTFSRFTVYCRSGDGEMRWRSWGRRGSVFQHAVWQGLTGEADGPATCDGSVDSSELITYLRNTLPETDPLDVFRFGETSSRLAYALPSGPRKDLLLTGQPPAPEITDSELLDAWQQCAELLGTEAWRKDLPATGRLLRTLSWWEGQLWSGRAGIAESATSGRGVRRWLSILQRQADVNPLPVGSYPLLKLQFQTGAEADRIDAAPTRQDELLLADDRNALRQLARSMSTDEMLGQTSLRAMASLLAEAAPPDSWQHPELIRKVLAQRARLESIAIPDDIRASRHFVAALEVPRKDNLAAFDLLQVGAASQSQTIHDALIKGDVSLDHCEAESTILHRQLALCDHIRLELPFLAEWASVQEAHASEGQDQFVNRILLPLIRGADELDARLHPPTAASSETVVTPQDVEHGWGELRSRFDLEWTRLLTLRHLDAEDLDSLERLLQVPLLSRADDHENRPPAEQRIVLLRKLVAARAQQSVEEVKRKPVPPAARMLDRWTAHPALVLTGCPVPAAESSEAEHRWAAINSEFCRRLSDAEETDSTSLSNRPPDEVLANRLLNSRRVIGPMRTSNNDRAEEYSKLAWGDLLLWLAEGALDEFWGPFPEANQTLMSQQVDRLLTVVSGMTDDRQMEVARLRQRLSNSLAAAETGIIVDAASLTPVSPSDSLSTQVSVRRPGTTIVLPSGTARVGIQHLGEAYPHDAAPVPLDDLSERATVENELTLDVQLIASSLTEVSQPLLAELWFRGNTYRSHFRIIPAGGRICEFDVVPKASTTFTVSSRQMRGAATTFILDCSASMQEEVPREGELGHTTRLTAAVSALKSLLEELTDQSEASVGVMLYGHRATHDPKSQKVIIQKRYADAFAVPDGLQPYQDVETILTPGRFGPGELGQVTTRLDEVLPWGETPLYMAVSQAASAFRDLPADVQRHIVVITDGRNYQFNPPPEQRVEFEEALARAQDQNVVVHVIGFGMSANDQHTAGDEFSRLASQTGGTSQLDVSHAAQLIQQLHTLVGPASFTWTGPDGVSHASPVNQPVKWTDRLPTKLTLTYGSATAEIQLKGGEAADLLGDDVTMSTNGLPSAEYTSLRCQFVALMSAHAQAEQWLAGAHQHQQSRTDAVFTFSLKRAGQLYLARPELYQITIQPLDSGGAELGGAYVYQGTEYVAGTPAPVMQITTSQWPIAATQAHARMSVIDSAAAAAETLSLPSASKGESSLAQGVQWELRQTANSVQCILRHQPASIGLGRLAVTWTAGPELCKVRRQLDPDAQIEVHTFVYAQTEDTDAPVSLRLSLPDAASQRVMPVPLRLPILTDEGLIAPAEQDRQTGHPPALARPDRADLESLR